MTNEMTISCVEAFVVRSHNSPGLLSLRNALGSADGLKRELEIEFAEGDRVAIVRLSEFVKLVEFLGGKVSP
jgi:hypothetical protein